MVKSKHRRPYVQGRGMVHLTSEAEYQAKILALLKRAGGCLTKSQLGKAFDRQVTGPQLQALLATLIADGRVETYDGTWRWKRVRYYLLPRQ